MQIRTGCHACEPGRQAQTCWDPTCVPYDRCKSTDCFLFSLVASTWATVSIKHEHILRTNNQKTWWGFKLTSTSEACGFSHMHIRRRSHSRQAGLRCTGCRQVTLSKSSTAADPSRRRCWLLTTHTTMAPVNPPLYGCPALMRHLIGRDELFAVAAWGPASLYTSHCPHLIRPLLPLVCVYMVCVYTCSVSICTSSAIFVTASVYMCAFAWLGLQITAYH